MMVENWGFLLIDKPKDITSHDVVDRLRKITGIKKIGHAGTLDPFATGLLILGIGRPATKKLGYFLKLDKEYITTLRLGATSNTFDSTGQIQFKKNIKKPTLNQIKQVLKQFIGKTKQIPPAFSAKKIKGKKLYELARQGKILDIKPQEINIYKIQILSYKFPLLTIKVKCSSGTYIRSLVNDIGEKLNVGAYTAELRRTKIGQFSVKQAQKLEKINSQNWQNYLKIIDDKINKN